LAIERRRRQLGWTSKYLDDRAGVQDGYYQKLLHSDAPTGRCGRLETLQLLVDALWGRGAVGLSLTRAAIPVTDDDVLQQQIEVLKRRHRKRDQAQRKIREHLREYASPREASP
jgi:hypothetical protein